MQRANAAGHVAIGRACETRLTDHIEKSFLIRKPADGFDQISVGIRVICEQFPHYLPGTDALDMRRFSLIVSFFLTNH